MISVKKHKPHKYRYTSDVPYEYWVSTTARMDNIPKQLKNDFCISLHVAGNPSDRTHFPRLNVYGDATETLTEFIDKGGLVLIQGEYEDVESFESVLVNILGIELRNNV